MNKRTDIIGKKDLVTAWLRDEGLTRAEVARRLDCQASTLKRYLDAWGLSEYKNQGGKGTKKNTQRKHNVEDYLAIGGPIIPTYTLKNLLWETGYKTKQCEECGITEWLGLPAPLELDHVNGDRHDHRIENLKILCPNCHALTPTYRGKNKKLKNEARMAEWQTQLP